MSENDKSDSQCCEGDKCDCGIDVEEGIKELRSEVDELREEIDFLIERRGLQQVLEDYKEE